MKNLHVGGTEGGTTKGRAPRSAKHCRRLNQNIHRKEKVMDMFLYLANKIHELGDDPQRFFRAAYMFKFGKDYDCVTDVVQYKLHAIVPHYVEDYVRHIQSSQGM